jgi:hypothetical protein
MIAVFIQGLLFGIMHMNLVQGVYAFLLGMILGYIRYKYKTVILTVCAHVVFNIFGTSVELLLEGAGITGLQRLILAAAGLALTAVVFVVIAKDKDSYTKDGKEFKTASQTPSDAS